MIPPESTFVGALCRTEATPDFWYPDGYQKAGLREQAEAARTICLRCPVRAACLELALLDEEGKSVLYRYGVRGGKFPGERYKIAAKRAKEAAETAAQDEAVAA